MPDEEQIERAIAHLKAQKQLNIAAASTQFKIPRTTLSVRFQGQRVSHKKVTANTRLKLSSIQKKTLITYINKRSNHRLPSISSFIRYLARELLKSKISKY
jgi:hypothetical protein